MMRFVISAATSRLGRALWDMTMRSGERAREATSV
jgi:hypothetical protein